jgi:hypothetical protein
MGGKLETRTTLNDMCLTDVDSLSHSKFKYYEKQINSLSDSEFDDFIMYLIQNTEDYDLLAENLAAFDIEFTKPNTLAQGASMSPMGVPSNNAYISVASARQGSQSYQRLYAYVKLNATETSPGSDDAVAVYFDSNKADFYSYNTGDYTSLKSFTQKDNGVLIFNFYDRISGSNQGYGVVYVTPKRSGVWIDYGAEWIHTYTTKSISYTPTLEFSYGGAGKVEGSLGVSWTVSSVEAMWQRADVNSFKW